MDPTGAWLRRAPSWYWYLGGVSYDSRTRRWKVRGRPATAASAAAEALSRVGDTMPETWRAWAGDVSAERGREGAGGDAWVVYRTDVTESLDDLQARWVSGLDEDLAEGEPESAPDPDSNLLEAGLWLRAQPRRPWYRRLRREGWTLLAEATALILTDDPSWPGSFGVRIASGGISGFGPRNTVYGLERVLALLRRRSDTRILAVGLRVYCEAPE